MRLLLSIDFEDWHQLVHRRLGFADWDRAHAALERQTAYLLDLLDELDAKATFFLLGMTVAQHREVVAEIVRRGHEPASHGYTHTRVYDQTRGEFRADVERSVEAIAGATGQRPVAYRAPAFSINRRTPWAYEVLAEAGFRYDSSQYDSPRVPDRLGDIPKEPYRLGELWELPVAGGGELLARAARPATCAELAVLYFHPYEFDPALRAELPSTATTKQRLAAAKVVAWRNAGRSLVERRLRQVAPDTSPRLVPSGLWRHRPTLRDAFASTFAARRSRLTISTTRSTRSSARSAPASSTVASSRSRSSTNTTPPACSTSAAARRASVSSRSTTAPRATSTSTSPTRCSSSQSERLERFGDGRSR